MGEFKVIMCPNCGNIQSSSASSAFKCFKCGKSKKIDSSVRILKKFDNGRAAALFIQEYTRLKHENGTV